MGDRTSQQRGAGVRRGGPEGEAVPSGKGKTGKMSLDTHKSDALGTDLAAAHCGALSADEMMEQAQSASNFLKALAHEGRLMILCHLSSGEKSVTELENLLSSRQAAVSQQLARLRLEGLVSCRREGKAIFYSLSDPKVQRAIELVYDMFCGPAPA